MYIKPSCFHGSLLLLADQARIKLFTRLNGVQNYFTPHNSNFLPSALEHLGSHGQLKLAFRVTMVTTLHADALDMYADQGIVLTGTIPD